MWPQLTHQLGQDAPLSTVIQPVVGEEAGCISLLSESKSRLKHGVVDLCCSRLAKDLTYREILREAEAPVKVFFLC